MKFKPDSRVELRALKVRLGRTQQALRCLQGNMYSEYRGKLIAVDWIREALSTRVLELEGKIVGRIGIKGEIARRL